MIYGEKNSNKKEFINNTFILSNMLLAIFTSIRYGNIIEFIRIFIILMLFLQNCNIKNRKARYLLIFFNQIIIIKCAMKTENTLVLET